jgi:hypothetical protein
MASDASIDRADVVRRALNGEAPVAVQEGKQAQSESKVDQNVLFYQHIPPIV